MPAILGTSILAMLLAAGCAGSAPFYVPDASSAAGSAVSRAQAHVGSAAESVHQAKPHTAPAGRPYLESATWNLDEAGQQLTSAGTELVHLNQVHQQQQYRVQELEGVVSDLQGWIIGPRGWRYIHLAAAASVLGWLIWGAAGALLCAGGGWKLKVGRELISALPLANLFGRLSWRIQSLVRRTNARS